MLGLILVGAAVGVGLIAYGLHKKGTAVTAGNIFNTAEQDAKKAAANTILKVETAAISANATSNVAANTIVG